MHELQMVVATRERPANVDRLVTSFLATSGEGTHLLLVQDTDDPQADWRLKFDRVTPIPFDRKGEAGCSRQLNYGAQLSAYGDYKYIGSVNDDHVFRTPGWDRLMMDALGDKVGVCYANDLFKGPKFPTAMIMSSVIIRALGCMHPEMYHGNPDQAWRELGKALGCLIYMPEVIIEHMHPLAGKGKVDAVYEAAHKQDAGDMASYRMWERDGFAKQVEAIRARVILEAQCETG